MRFGCDSIWWKQAGLGLSLLLIQKGFRTSTVQLSQNKIYVYDLRHCNQIYSEFNLISLRHYFTEKQNRMKGRFTEFEKRKNKEKGLSKLSIDLFFFFFFFFLTWNKIEKESGARWKLVWLCPLAEAERRSHAVRLHYSVGLEGSCLPLITSMRNSHITAW